MKLDLFKINKKSNTPISEQIANQVQKLILDGSLEAGEKLPPERDLAEHLNVSRGTIKRAYAKLSKMDILDVRQGSGSYVLKNGHILEQNQKREAAEIIASTFLKLNDMGLSEKEILNLVNLRYLNSAIHNGIHKFTIMVVSNNHDILNELEQQLSYLSFSSPFLFTLSFMTLDTIATNPDPVQVLLAYDLIIATSIDYPEIIKLAPMLKNKVLEASLSPRTKTLAQLSSLPPDSKFSVIYRTERFKSMVMRYLLSLDYAEDNIFCYSDIEYNPKSHSQNGVNVVINFNESPVYTNPGFKEKNHEFINNGGHIIRFEYQIERSSLVFIEDQIQKLLSQNESNKQGV